MGKKAVSTILDIEQDGRVNHAKQKHAPPPEEQHALTKLGNATRMLAEVRDAPSAKKVMDLAAAAELYARKAKLGQDAIDYAFGVKLDAQRKLGEYIKDAPKAKTGPKPEAELVSDTENKSRLNVYKELEISPKMAAESQRLAELDDDVYERVRKREIKPSIAFRDQKRQRQGALVG